MNDSNNSIAIRNITERQVKRFLSQVDVRGEDECHEWQGTLNSHGYGQATAGSAYSAYSSSISAPRVAYFIEHGDYDMDMEICHTCDNRKCCNPRHLELGTRADNQRQCGERGRRGNVGKRIGGTMAAAIKQLLANGITQAKIAVMANVTPFTVSHINTGHTWNDIAWPEPNHIQTIEEYFRQGKKCA